MRNSLLHTHCPHHLLDGFILGIAQSNCHKKLFMNFFLSISIFFIFYCSLTHRKHIVNHETSWLFLDDSNKSSSFRFLFFLYFIGNSLIKERLFFLISEIDFLLLISMSHCTREMFFFIYCKRPNGTFLAIFLINMAISMGKLTA